MKKSIVLLVVFFLMRSLMAQDAPPQGTPYVVFTVQNHSQLQIDFSAKEDSTDVWVQLTDSTYEHKIVGTTWLGYQYYTMDTNIFKLYGNINQIDAGYGGLNTKNKIKAIDASNNNALVTFFCQHNLMDACALDSFYISLPKIATEGWLINDDNPGVYASNTQIAIDKGWTDEITEGDGTGCNLSVSNFTKSIVKLYPNPAHQYVSVDVPPTLQGSDMYIYNAIGRLIAIKQLNDETNQVDISSLKPGLYIVETDQGTARFIVK